MSFSLFLLPTYPRVFKNIYHILERQKHTNEKNPSQEPSASEQSVCRIDGLAEVFKGTLSTHAIKPFSAEQKQCSAEQRQMKLRFHIRCPSVYLTTQNCVFVHNMFA